MFDIGFVEILVIGAIALFVVGPERLPEAVRNVSMWIGRLKRSLRDTKREIELQIGADDIRRELHNEEVMHNLNKIRSDVTQTLNQEIDLDGDNHSIAPDTGTAKPESTPPESNTSKNTSPENNPSNNKPDADQ